MIAVGEIVELEVERCDDRGAGRGPVEDRTVVVPGVFPGERAHVRIEALARHSQLAHARLHELARPSPARRELPCPRHEHADRGPTRDRSRPKPSCGGCPMMAIEVAAQREAIRAWIEAEHDLVLTGEIVGGDELGYRWSSKRIVGGQAGKLRLGSRSAGRKRGDHIADMHGCLVDHPRIRAAFDGLEREADALGIEPWRGPKSGGDLRYVWAKTNGEQVLLTLITGASVEHSRTAAELGPRLLELGLADGVAHGVQDEVGNAIRSEAATHLAGLEQLTLELGGVSLEIGPLGFLQPNPLVVARAYRDLVGDAPPGNLALDLYAGAGVTTELLRARFTEVAACEAHPESAARLGVEPQRVEEFLQQRRAWTGAPELIVANPPRAGLGAEVCERLLEIAAPRLHLMSCSARSLAEDLGRLAPRYRLVELRGYDTLPQTAHIELVARLELG